jgi:hypothetical protein
VIITENKINIKIKQTQIVGESNCNNKGDFEIAKGVFKIVSVEIV